MEPHDDGGPLVIPARREWRCVWQACPHVHHRRHVAFVLADTQEDARRVLRDHIERSEGIEWFSIHDVAEAPARPAGQVVQP